MIVPMADCAGRALAGLLAPCTHGPCTHGPCRARAPSTVVPAMLSVASTRTCPLCTTGPKSSAIITAPGEKCGLARISHQVACRVTECHLLSIRYLPFSTVVPGTDCPGRALARWGRAAGGAEGAACGALLPACAHMVATPQGVAMLPSLFLRGVPPRAAVFLRGVPSRAAVFLRGVPPRAAVFLRGVPPRAAVFLRGVPPRAAVFLRAPTRAKSCAIIAALGEICGLAGDGLVPCRAGTSAAPQRGRRRALRARQRRPYDLA